MKKNSCILAVVLIFVLILALATACGDSKKPAASNSGNDNETVQGDKTNSSGNKEETYSIDLVSTFPAGNVNYEVCKIFCEKVSEVTDGRLQFNLLGGSEIFGGAAGAEAVMNGALDAVYTAADYINGFVPATAAICASNMTNAEMTASGGIDYLNEIMAGNGIRLLFVVDEVGISGTEIFTKNEISTLDELKGLNIRTAGTVQVDILTSLSCTATPLGLPDVFPGLEQGLIDGYVGPAYLGRGEGFFEYVKCVINTEIARGGSSMWINTQVWEEIPQDVRDMLMENIEEVNAAMVELYKEYVTNNQTAIVEAGGKVVELNDADRGVIMQANQEYAWKSVENLVDADTYNTLRQMFVK